MVKPVARRKAAGHLRASYEISERRASRLLVIHRSSLRYAARPDDSGPLRERLRGMAVNHPRWGYRLMTLAAGGGGGT